MAVYNNAQCDTYFGSYNPMSVAQFTSANNENSDGIVYFWLHEGNVAAISYRNWEANVIVE